jgi:ABC-type spermidine/putrescine transport system permease subunit II
LVPAILLLRRGGLNQSHDNQRGRIPNKASNNAAVWLVRLLLCVSAGLICLWPVFTNCRDVVDGFRSLAAQGSFQSRSEQILISVFAATLSSVCALQFSIGLRTFRTQWISLVPILPGLCGALVLSLFLLAAFQLPILHALYDTWVPMLLGQTLLMLPRAFLLVVLLEITSQKLALHSATLMTHSPDLKIARRGRGLIWRLRSLRWLLATAVLTHWSLWDVTTAAILRPTRFEPIVNRLYNEMHYGRTETLVAITAMTLVIPGLAFLAAAIIWRFLPTREQISNG